MLHCWGGGSTSRVFCYSCTCWNNSPDITLSSTCYSYDVYFVWVVSVLLEYLVDRTSTHYIILCNFPYAVQGTSSHFSNCIHTTLITISMFRASQLGSVLHTPSLIEGSERSPVRWWEGRGCHRWH
jgi:hypothetical protein